MTPRRRTIANSRPARTLNTKSTGEILRSARESRGESLQQVSQAIKVRVSMLQAIEDGKFFGLTDPLYLKGFIRAYAMHVGLKEVDIMPFFRREYDEQEHQQQQIAKPLTPIESRKSTLTPSKVIIGVLILAITTVVGYSYNQYVSVALTPSLIINSPKNDTAAESGQVEVSGETDPDAQLSLNGQSVTLTPNGEFKLSVALAAGSNTLQFKAINKLGKSTVVERTVVGPSQLAQKSREPIAPLPSPTVLAASQSAVLTQASPSAATKEVKIEVVVGPSPIWLEIKADGSTLFSGMILPGATQTFAAKREIYLKTGNAGSTKVLLHGVDQGLLGKENEVVEKTYK